MPSGPDALAPEKLPSTAELGTGDRVLAEIDHDGFLFAAHPADKALFNRRPESLPHQRSELQVVLEGGRVCVRKRFRSGAGRDGVSGWFWGRLAQPFYTEAAALIRLRGCPGVPILRSIDVKQQTVTMDYVEGATLRQLVGDAGHPVHDQDIERDPELRRLTPAERDAREARLYRTVLDGRYNGEIGELIRTINNKGVLLFDIKLGNVSVGASSGRLYWLDYESATLTPSPGEDEQRDLQFSLLNQWFGTEFWTRERIRQIKADPDSPEFPGDRYSPVDLGWLGQIGDMTDPERGEARWHWLLNQQTEWTGKRVLDLGANNSVYAVRMLQAGAAEVHCVEMNPNMYRQAQLVRSVTEQLEGRPLPICLHASDMKSFLLENDFPDGYFDVAMALCSIYYQSEDDIRACMAVIRRIAKECWLQANIVTHMESDEGLGDRSSVEFLRKQMEEAGFTDVTVIAPRGYRRPLLIGRKPVGVQAAERRAAAV
jgi:SAM-dependent methyltransferase/tRNA A-37 threonylcarbamoyl transferase component Bud32